MSRRRRLAASALAAAAAALAWLSACGFDGSGTGARVTVVDGGVDLDAATLEDVVTAPPPESEAGSEIELDPDGGCTARDVVDPLTTIDRTRWIVTNNAAAGTAPRSSSIDGTPLTVLVGYTRYSRGALWLAQPVPLVAFEVTFSFVVGCSRNIIGELICADGLAATWMNTNDPARLDQGGVGDTFGIPGGVKGGAVVVDVYGNGGEPAPMLKMLGLDPTRPPGGDGWRVASTGALPLTGRGHRMRIRAEKGRASVTVDGAPALEAPATLGGTGTFGLSAATGGEDALMAVWDFRGRFLDCDP